MQTNPPELLYLLHSDAAELTEALSQMRAEDIAVALRDLPADAAAKVMAALPFDLAVRVFDEPEISHSRCDIIRRHSRVVSERSRERRERMTQNVHEASRSRIPARPLMI